MTARPPTPSSSSEPRSTRAPRRRSWPTAWPTPTSWSTAGVSDRVITVGGFQPGDITSEAQTGKEELVADGMRRAQVIALPFGENTEESMKAVAAIVKSEGLSSVTLVTDPAHSARAHALASQFGLDAHVSATDEGPGTTVTSEYLLRESAGLITVWFDR